MTQIASAAITQQDCQALDAQDPLRTLRDQFQLPPGVIYLDGNSLGVLPKTASARVADVVSREWGTDLIQSWNKNHWFALPQTVGDKIARLIGAAPGEVVAAAFGALAQTGDDIFGVLRDRWGKVALLVGTASGRAGYLPGQLDCLHS